MYDIYTQGVERERDRGQLHSYFSKYESYAIRFLDYRFYFYGCKSFNVNRYLWKHHDPPY